MSTSVLFHRKELCGWNERSKKTRKEEESEELQRDAEERNEDWREGEGEGGLGIFKGEG